MSVGKRVKEIRIDNDLTQAEFAERIFRDKSSISKLESDNSTLSPAMCKAICRTFNIREEWLTDGRGEKTRELQEAALMKQTIEYATRKIPRSIKQNKDGNIRANKQSSFADHPRHPAAVPYPEPMPGNYHHLDSVQIDDDLLMAKAVLESGTGYATSLHMNIRSFKESVDEKRKREDLEAKQNTFEQKVSAEIQNLKTNFETLQSENRVLRTENNRLKSTYEDPDVGDEHLTLDTGK